jgi:hypothetical protein
MQNKNLKLCGRVNKSSLIWLPISFFLAVNFGYIRYIPGFKEIYIVIVCLSGIIGFGLSVKESLVDKQPLEPLGVYGLFICIYLLVASALAAFNVFGQPLIYGFLTSGNRATIASICVIHYFWNARLLRFNDLMKAIIACVAANSIYATSLELYFDPNAFELIDGFVVGMPGERQFSVNCDFLIIGFLVLLLRCINLNSMLSGVGCVVLLMILSFNIGRGAWVALIIATFSALLLSRSIAVMIKAIIFFFASILILILVHGFDKIEIKYEKFTDAVVAAVKGESVNDISANSRVDQILIAKEYIENYPLFGSGLLSPKFLGGYASKLGYFHVTDIGVYGIIFSIGIIGLILVSVQFVFYFDDLRFAYSLPISNESIYVKAFCAYLVYFVLVSVTSAACFENIQNGLYISTVILMFKKESSFAARPT